MKAVWFAGSVSLVLWGLLGLAASAGADDNEADKGPGTKDALSLAAYHVEDSNIQHVVYRGSGGDIIELSRQGKDGDAIGWHSKNLTAQARAPKAASTPTAYVLTGDRLAGGSTTQHVVYRGTDDQIYKLSRDAREGRWKHKSLTLEARAPRAAGCPAGYAPKDSQVEHVFYRTSDGAIYELYRGEDDNAWRANNLTDRARAARAAGDPVVYLERAGTVLGRDYTQHVVYRGEDGHVHEFSLAPRQAGWQYANLTTEAGAPRAAGDPAASFAQHGNVQHVFYRTADGAVYELYRDMEGADKAWRAHNLTAEASAPRAAGDPAAYVVRVSRLTGSANTQHVVYRGADDQIHELYLAAKQGKWQHTNLTTEARAPRAAGDPAGFDVSADNVQHVFYRTADRAVYVLFRKAEGDDQGWHARNLTAATKLEW